jgi:GTP pyrophosphokinase
MGSIENQQLKDFAAQKSNTLMNFFKSKMKRTDQQQMRTYTNKLSNYDMLVLGRTR